MNPTGTAGGGASTGTCASTPSTEPPHSGSASSEASTSAPAKKPKQAPAQAGAQGSTTAAVASLPQVPPHDLLAGVNCLLSGRGMKLQAPSVESVLAALKLFGDDSGGSRSSDPATALPVGSLPVGSDWQLVSISTPEGPQSHTVQPGVEAPDARDPQRLTTGKRRACEE